MQNPGVERSPRGTQLLIVYSAVAIIVVYYALTAWVPWVVQYMRTHLDRRKVLDVLRDEVKDGTDEALAELRNYKHRKTDTTTPKPATRARPNFVLTTKTIPVWSSSSTSTEEQATPATRIPSPTQSRRPPMFQPKQTASKASVVSTDSTAQYPSRDLSTFTSDSVEARLHQSRGIRSSGTSSSTVSELNEQRALRERQDAEYKRSEQLDLERQSEAKAKQEHLERVAERREQLAALVPPEPQDSTEDKVVTLQFRFRETSGSGAASQAQKQKQPRITRKFSVSRHTAADLLNYVESLELRPLLSGTYELTLDFPTRVISCGGKGSKTLEEVGIDTDSVVWVTFSGD